MDQAVRHLRDGSVTDAAGRTSCALALVYSNLDSVGTQDLMYQLVADYQEAVHQQRAQATHMRLLMLDGSMTGCSPSPSLSLLDGWSDPAGWLKEEHLPTRPGYQTITSIGPGALQQLLTTLTILPFGSNSMASLCIVVDSLSPLFQSHPDNQALRFMEELRHHPAVSCILASVQQDVVGAGTCAALQRMASCVVQLGPVSSLQHEVLSKAMRKEAHGVATFAYKSRRAGRMRTETMFYTLRPESGGVHCFQAPPELASLTTAGSLVSLLVQGMSSTALGATPNGTIPSAAITAGQPHHVVAPNVGFPPGAAAGHGVHDTAGGASADLRMALAGGMKLTLTEEEQQARQAVLLPFEHKGGGSAYATGEWRDYLPKAAGGWSGANHSQKPAGTVPGQILVGSGEGQPQLGSILYVRDSDEEGGLHDSDEDPDDDLDL